MRAFRTCIFATLLLVAPGTTQSASQEQEEIPRFRTEVSNVLVDVLVLDEQGEPVAGLARDDFAVFEDGVRQEIERFEAIDWTSYVAQTAPREPSEETPDEAAVNTFPRRFIFIVNRQLASTTYIRRAKQALETFVVESMAEGDEALIIDMGFSTKVLQQFRPSKEDTLATISKIPLLPTDLYGRSDIGTRNVYETLESLGQGLGQLPGRKIVIFLSPQLPRLENLLTDLRDTVDSLNQSNTSVYSINIEGLDSGPDDIGGLFPLANETGGRYYTNRDTFEPFLQKIGQENRRYYLLTYTPSNTEEDGEFREISVTVDRPNVEVVARRGYVARKRQAPEVTDATPPPTASDDAPPAPAEAPAPLETTEVDAPVTAPKETSPTETAAAGTSLGPSPPAQLEITNYLFPAGDQFEVPITIALPRDMLPPAGSEPRTLKMTISEDSQGVISEYSDRVDLRQFFMVRNPTLGPGLYLLQMTLEEPSGEQVYQASTALEVPRGFGNRFGFSSIVPVFAPSGESSGQAQAIQIRPTPEVERGQDAYLYFRILPGEDAGSAGDDTRLSYVVTRDEEEVTAGEHPTSLRLSGGGESGFPVVLRLPTSGLPPGTYRVTLRIESSGLNRRASTEIELTIR